MLVSGVGRLYVSVEFRIGKAQMGHTKMITRAAQSVETPNDDAEQKERRIDAWILAAGLFTQLPREGDGEEAERVVDRLRDLVRQVYER